MSKRFLRFMFILGVYALITSSAFAKTDNIRIDGDHGKLSAVIQTPDNKSQYPIVIICHGFTSQKEFTVLKNIADFLEADGIASIRFDFNGHGESEGRFQDMTVLNEIEDLKKVYEYVRTLPEVTSISLAGHSQGGVVSSMTAGELGEKIKSIVLLAPAAVLRDDAIRGNLFGSIFNPLNPPEYIEIFNGLKVGKNYPITARDLQIYETASKYKGYALMIHGTGDNVVPYTYSLRYHEIWPDSEICIMPEWNHGFTGNEIEAAKLAAEFFSRTLNENIKYFTQPKSVRISSTPYGNNLLSGQYVQADDAKIYYEVYGEGKPVFVFHGGGVGFAYEMGQFIDRLKDKKDKYKVVSVSTRGHGRSEIGHTALSFEQKANDMIAVMKKITDQPAILIGFSDGAYTAYKVASMYPEAVDRVIAVGAGTLRKGFFKGKMLLSDLEKADKIFIEQQKNIRPEPERWQEFINSYMSFWSEMEAGTELFSSIKCPVLLIAGDEDDHAPLATMLEAHQIIPNSRLFIIPKAWHDAFHENFELVWDAVEPFILQDVTDLKPSNKVEYNNHFKYMD